MKWPWKESIGYTIQKSGQMVLKGVNWVHNDKIRSNGLERSQLYTQCKIQVIWSWNDSFGYTMIKLGQTVLKGVNWVHMIKLSQMVLKGVNRVHNAKIRSYGLEMSHLGTQQ